MVQFGPPFVAAFIHRVAEKKASVLNTRGVGSMFPSAEASPAPSGEPDSPEAVDHPRIRYFHGYLDASKIALEKRLISRSGHLRVGQDSWNPTWLQASTTP